MIKKNLFLIIGNLTAFLVDFDDSGRMRFLKLIFCKQFPVKSIQIQHHVIAITVIKKSNNIVKNKN